MSTLEDLSQHPRTSLQQAFAADPSRGQRFSRQAPHLHFDFSKNHIDNNVFSALLDKANSANIAGAIQRLIQGDLVNPTEQRAALHTLLRAPEPPPGANTFIQAAHQSITRCRQGIRHISHQLRNGEWRGFNGQPIRQIINIGIGGSDLGSRLVVQALAEKDEPIKVDFVANLDASELDRLLSSANAAETLFIITSKTFSTLETLSNARLAIDWLRSQGCPKDQLGHHLIGVTSRVDRATAMGIREDNILPMWDWVGGRYSLWSAVGASIAIAIGADAFDELLYGAAEMDQHLQQSAPEDNVPLIAALLSYWYGQYQDTKTHAVLAYSHALRSLPAWLQQLDMESLGKRVSINGEPLKHPSGQIIWGSEEPNGQHSFHQLLLQGTHQVAVDFIACINPLGSDEIAHRQLLASCLSQSQALLQGRSRDEVIEQLITEGKTITEAEALAEHLVIPGNSPSNTLLLDALTPRSLGSLLAFYEHKTYLHSVLLGINAFDQWGVELGKQLGARADEVLASGNIPSDWDSSSRLLAQTILASKT